MTIRRFSFFAIIFFIVMSLVHPSASVSAAKKLIRGPRIINVSFSKVALSRPTHSAVISFFNLKKVKRIEYTLSYTANGIAQGVMGSFAPSGQAADNRNLYFGTCSKGACTPHYGIQNASLIVTTVLTSGGTNTKRYKFKRV